MAKKPAAHVRVAEVLAPFGFPSAPGPGLCFRPQDDALLARGFPAMRLLTQAPPAPGLLAQVVKALDAIDPVLGRFVPRPFARLYLLGYSVGPGLFVAPAFPPENVERRARREERMRSAQEPDLALLDLTLRTVCRGMGDTYGRWRYLEVLCLYEAFLGTDPVALTLAAFLDELARTPGIWGDFLWRDPRRTNAPGNELAIALGWLLRRASPDAVRQVRALLSRAPRSEEAPAHSPHPFLRQLAWLSDPQRFRVESPLDLDVAWVEDDADHLRARLERLGGKVLFESPARLVWVLGAAPLALPISVAGHDLPALVEQLGLFRDPGVVRVMAHIATQRRGGAAAGVWLRAHADHARPVLEALRSLDDPKEQKAAEAALALLGPAARAAAPAVLDEDQVEEELVRLFTELGGKLGHTRGGAARKRLIREAHERYTEIRSAGGDPTPEAYFTHRFGDFGLGAYAMLAVEAIEE